MASALLQQFDKMECMCFPIQSIAQPCPNSHGETSVSKVGAYEVKVAALNSIYKEQVNLIVKYSFIVLFKLKSLFFLTLYKLKYVLLPFILLMEHKHS